MNGIAVGVKEPFELKRGIKIDPTRELLEYIRTRFIYADTMDDDVVLPRRTYVSLVLTMPEPLEKQYRDKAKPARVALEGLVSIYRDRGIEVSDEGAPQVYKDKKGRERTRLTRQPCDPRVHSIRGSLKPTISELTKLTNTPDRVGGVARRRRPIVSKQTPAEWRKYVDELTEDELWETAERANSVAFVQGLQAEGYEASEIHDIFVLFARCLRALGQVPPAPAYVDLEWLAQG